MKTITNPVQIAKNFKDTIEVYAEQNHTFKTELMLNEFEEVGFECDAVIDYATIIDGDGYLEPITKDYDVQNIDLTLKNVFDGDGQEIEISEAERIEIEKHLEKGLKIELI